MEVIFPVRHCSRVPPALLFTSEKSGSCASPHSSAVSASAIRLGIIQEGVPSSSHGDFMICMGKLTDFHSDRNGYEQ